MKEKSIKIAIVSPFAELSRYVSMNIGKSLNIPILIKEVNDVDYQSIYSENNKDSYTSNEIHTILLNRFHSKIKAETIPCFISDGSVLDDIVLKKWDIQQTKLLKRSFSYRLFSSKYHEFEKKVEKLIEDHAQTVYDKIYFLKDMNYQENKFSVFFEHAMFEILDRKNIAYVSITGNPESSLHDTMDDLNHRISDTEILNK